MPFFRELLLAYGFTGVDKKSVAHALRRDPKKRDTKAVMICIGGAREALLTRPGRMDLVLHRRKGFVKMALMAG